MIVIVNGKRVKLSKKYVEDYDKVVEQLREQYEDGEELWVNVVI